MRLWKFPILGRGGFGFLPGNESVSAIQGVLSIKVIPGPNHKDASISFVNWLRELRNLILRGDRYNYGIVGKRCVTTAFVNYLRSCITDGANSACFKYHDMGIGTTAEAVGDTGLVTPWGGSRVTGTQDATTSKIYKSVATITVNASKAITEHGIFSASTSGTLLDRTVFAAKSLISGDGIEFTYALTINDGG